METIPSDGNPTAPPLHEVLAGIQTVVAPPLDGCVSGSAISEFAGPLAPGVLDPSISHVPSAVLILWFFLEHPRGHGSQKCDPRRILGGSLADPRRILGGFPLWVATFLHSKNVGNYPSICIWAARERTRAPN